MNNNLKKNDANFVNLKDNEFTNMYVKDIMKFKPLTASEEKELFIAYNNAVSESEKNSIRNSIIERNQRFVYAVAKRYSQDDSLLPDLIGEGNIGLYEAFDNYDVNSGHRFCTFAVWYIRRSINAFITTGNVLIKKSNNTKTLGKLTAINDAFFVKNGRFPTSEETIEILDRDYGIKLKKSCDLYDLKIETIMSNDDDDDVYSPFEHDVKHLDVNSVDPSTVDNSEEDYADRVISYLANYLSEDEYRVMSMSYGFGEEGADMSADDIANELGISVSRVRQLKVSALKKMKNHACEVAEF